MANSETEPEMFSRSVFEGGFACVDNVLDEDEVNRLIEVLESKSKTDSSLRKGGGTFAIRNLLEEVPDIAALAGSAKIHRLVEPILGGDSFPVRGILFDKIPGANWLVPWHQDVTIAVQKRVEADGFGPWSMKAGVPHVQPPAEILENMLSVRLHLDSCDETNGALRVVPGSQKLSRIPEGSIPEFRERLGEHLCVVGRGGALLMRPLLLHASSPSESPSHRRVIHIDFAASSLPHGMRWFAGLENSNRQSLSKSAALRALAG